MPKLEKAEQALGQLSGSTSGSNGEVPRHQGLQHGLVLRDEVEYGGLTRIFGVAICKGNQEGHTGNEAYRVLAVVQALEEVFRDQTLLCRYRAP